jgi:hypothetical protein
MRQAISIIAAGLVATAALGATPASAALYNFSFSGSGQSGSGILTTASSSTIKFGETAFAITGISGMLNGSAITGLSGFLGSDNYYFTTGTSFVDGSGVGFTTAAGTSASLYYQSTASSYRITTVSPFATAFVTATSSAVAAVPEPASWAMMIAGFGLVGGAMRRRSGQVLATA